MPGTASLPLASRAVPLRAIGLAALISLGACGESQSTTPDAAVDDAAVQAEPDLAALPDLAPPGPTCERPLPFSTEGTGATWGQRAAGFTLKTLDGELDFKAAWTGCEGYVFVILQPGLAYSKSLWRSSVDDLIGGSPTNVHYVFMSAAPDNATAEGQVGEMRDRALAAVASLPGADQAAWAGKVHFAALPATKAGGWLGTFIAKAGVTAFGIDRAQRLREVGLLYPVGQSMEPQLDYLAHEARYWNFEADRELRLAAQKDARVVTLLDGVVVQGDAFAEVDLPSAADMAKYDTLEIDLDAQCDAGTDNNCGEWDYLSYVFLCDEAAPDTCGLEVGRFITTYHRQGRWVADASGMLWSLAKGGKRRFRLAAPNKIVARLSLRFSDGGKGYHPFAAQPLYTGGDFNQAYNGKYMPITVTPPAGTKRVLVYAMISGHGFGDRANCAEFCSHEHEFTINGRKHVKDFPEAGTNAGCIDQIEEGTVPNQFGTWPFGRGGWCPGKEVRPYVEDVTADVKLGAENTITYRGLYRGKDYVPMPGNGGGFGARIDLVSFLVFAK